MVLKLRNTPGRPSALGSQGGGGYSRQGSDTSISYGYALSPSNNGADNSSVSSMGSSYSYGGNQDASHQRNSTPLSPSFFGSESTRKATNPYGFRQQRKSPAIRTMLYCIAIAGAAYYVITSSYSLRSKESKLQQMMSDYHVLHHKVRETSSALDAANKVNHELEDKTRKLDKANGTLKRELEKKKNNAISKATGIDAAMLEDDEGDEVKKMGKEEITTLLMTRQEAMKSRISTLQTKIQEISRREAIDKFGDGPHWVKVTVDFNAGTKKGESRSDLGSFMVEMAPLSMMPHSVHLFLQMVDHKLWDDTVFLHTAHHVLQAAPIGYSDGRSRREEFKDANLDELTFQEYSKDYPHVKYTVGFGGRPGGPDFYISTQDNSQYHGPGGQGHHDLHEEADPCFGKVVKGTKVIDRMHRRSIATVGRSGSDWNKDDVPITSIVAVEIIENI